MLPLYGSILALAMFASLGLPALAGFAAEVQIVLGALGVFSWAAAGMLLAILITTALFLWTLQRVLFGPLSPEWARLAGLTPREMATLFPLVALIVVLGIIPGPVVSVVQTALSQWVLGPIRGG